MTLYNQIGNNYDTTRHPDPHIVQCLIDFLKIETQYMYIDIACGSGNYTNAIAKKGALMYGIDESSIMIDMAKKKNSEVNWFVRNAEKLPFDDSTFHGAICTLAIHHFSSIYLVFREIFRVLEQGNFVIFTSTQEQMQNYWLNEYFPKAMEVSIKQMPSLVCIEQDLRDAGFTSICMEPYNVNNELQDLFLYSGKDRPELYLNPHFREGISTFACLANKNEVEDGCNRISMDIESGRINKIMTSHKSTIGDYLFVVAKK